MERVAADNDAAVVYRTWDVLRRPIWMFDPVSGRGVYANRPALALWGSDTLEALLARDFSNLSPAVQARTHRLVQTTAGGESVNELWTFYPNGRPITVQATISTLILEGGWPVLLFEASAVAIEPAESRAVEALRHTTTLISLFGQDGQPLFANPGAFAAYADETLGFADRFVRHAVADALWQRALDDRRAVDVCEVRTLEGRRWHHMVLTTTLDPVTGETGLLLNEQDVTARVEAEQARAAAEQKAAMAETRRRFLSDMSHELRTPLNTILGFAEVMAHEGLPQRTLDQVSRISGAGHRLHALVNEMIDRSESDDLSDGATATTVPRIGSAESGKGGEADGGVGPRVLYVDDNENNRTLVVTILATQGLVCETAEDGLQGLAAVEQGDFDLILMDIAMPVMDGVEASRRIRGLDGPKRALPIVAVTANTLPEQLQAYAEAGINDCLPKPISMVGLLTMVSAWGSVGAVEREAPVQARA
ncbi:hypothetical protein BZG35_02640 [Brevundimonas sp. LM2]|uniref:response regulator n=1 Tax=Brevundimonas sp. LM2 TaxID=1938605 RepID=UPI000983E4B1|nr:response regulator [Brevundimonas sp. LM2]AQR60669.1 hypothetical protein BZG35_02640 [Brevundimonas sp. LM2]